MRCAPPPGLSPSRLVAVLGHGREQVVEFLSDAIDLPPVITAIQDQQLGTGHACACALDVTGELTGTVLVTYGDVPLLPHRDPHRTGPTSTWPAVTQSRC